MFVVAQCSSENKNSQRSYIFLRLSLSQAQLPCRTLVASREFQRKPAGLLHIFPLLLDSLDTVVHTRKMHDPTSGSSLKRDINRLQQPSLYLSSMYSTDVRRNPTTEKASFPLVSTFSTLSLSVISFFF